MSKESDRALDIDGEATKAPWRNGGTIVLAPDGCSLGDMKPGFPVFDDEEMRETNGNMLFVTEGRALLPVLAHQVEHLETTNRALIEALEEIADYSPGSTVQPALIARATLKQAKGESE